MLRMGPILVVLVAVGVVARDMEYYRPDSASLTDYINANSAILINSHPDYYDSSSRGLPDGNVTHLSVSYNVIDVRNPEQDLLEVAGWVILSWKDWRLAWNPEERAGIEKVYMDRKRIWVPDLTVVDQAMPTERIDNRLVVWYSGQIYWVPQEFWRVSCPALLTDKEYFNCSIKFGSWIHDTEQVDISARVEGTIKAKNRTDLNVTAINVISEMEQNAPYQFNNFIISLHRQADETRGKKMWKREKRGGELPDAVQGLKWWKREKKEKRGGELPDAVDGLTEQMKDLVGAVSDLAEKP